MLVLSAFLAWGGAGLSRAAMVSVPATMDNTLFNNSDQATRPLSNGQGQHFFAGVTGINNGNEVRRGLLYFDVAGALPEGAVIDAVVLQVTVSLSPPGSGADAFTVHRALSSWGEGTSDAPDPEGRGTGATPGDATWQHRFFPDVVWETPGGEFVGAASATALIGGPGTYTFAGAGLAADAQGWVDAPETNFGWFLLGDESATMNARRFDSREHFDPNNAPTLLLDYTIIPEPGTLALAALGLVLLRGRAVRRASGRPRSGGFE